ncbi:unnamed protein product [Notodromas monacha]|uniref:Uncharacterized protein n=1 Tax=Notodromas monacha TaxID=399045 RepID=A0A7R9BLE7_9CRUS|nr:unnamed protein product [Notodromas monacha]CAG0917637.1 unnamed protein product [Notodromas monacha]
MSPSVPWFPVVLVSLLQVLPETLAKDSLPKSNVLSPAVLRLAPVKEDMGKADSNKDPENMDDDAFLRALHEKIDRWEGKKRKMSPSTAVDGRLSLVEYLDSKQRGTTGTVAVVDNVKDILSMMKRNRLKNAPSSHLAKAGNRSESTVMSVRKAEDAFFDDGFSPPEPPVIGRKAVLQQIAEKKYSLDLTTKAPVETKPTTVRRTTKHSVLTVWEDQLDEDYSEEASYSRENEKPHVLSKRSPTDGVVTSIRPEEKWPESPPTLKYEGVSEGPRRDQQLLNVNNHNPGDGFPKGGTPSRPVVSVPIDKWYFELANNDNAVVIPGTTQVDFSVATDDIPVTRCQRHLREDTKPSLTLPGSPMNSQPWRTRILHQRQTEEKDNKTLTTTTTTSLSLAPSSSVAPTAVSSTKNDSILEMKPVLPAVMMRKPNLPVPVRFISTTSVVVDSAAAGLPIAINKEETGSSTVTTRRTPAAVNQKELGRIVSVLRRNERIQKLLRRAKAKLAKRRQQPQKKERKGRVDDVQAGLQVPRQAMAGSSLDPAVLASSSQQFPVGGFNSAPALVQVPRPAAVAAPSARFPPSLSFPGTRPDIAGVGQQLIPPHNKMLVSSPAAEAARASTEEALQKTVAKLGKQMSELTAATSDEGLKKLQSSDTPNGTRTPFALLRDIVGPAGDNGLQKPDEGLPLWRARSNHAALFKDISDSAHEATNKVHEGKNKTG